VRCTKLWAPRPNVVIIYVDVQPGVLEIGFDYSFSIPSTNERELVIRYRLRDGVQIFLRVDEI